MQYLQKTLLPRGLHMKHKQYETWILMGDELTLEQQRELHIHLKECSQCQALHRATQQVAHLFKTSAVPVPAEGFTNRWSARIDRQERRKRNLILLITLAAIITSGLLLLAGIGFQLSVSLASFPTMLMSLIARLTNWVVFLSNLWDIFDPLFSIGIKYISPAWVLTFGFGISGILAAWMISLYRNQIIQKELVQ